MALARHFLREFRPLFRMLEEPMAGLRSPSLPVRSFFEDPLLSAAAARPAVDITEQSGAYIVEADLPGVKKENLEVRIDDGGRSVTIAGKVVSQRVEGEPSSEASPEGEFKSAFPIFVHVRSSCLGVVAGSITAKRDPDSNQITSERFFTGSSMFSRTIWLPRPVDPNKVSAKLQDGILTLTIPKAEDKGSVKVDVE